ncbi:MAG: formylglycine-generating enzyme family protein [Cyanobacteria bacterium J06560_6]
MSENLATLIARLQDAGVDWDGENIADLLWLSSYVDVPEQREQTPDEELEERQDAVRVEINDSEPAPLPELSLYGQAPRQSQKKPREKTRSGIPFKTPTAPALRRTLELGRSLRPLMRKVDSYTRLELDEAATAEQTAEQQFCMTVVRPARDRWLELALVIEDSASSFLWRDTIRDFQQVLERQGAFRTVNTWYLQTTSAHDSRLFANRPKGGAMPRARSPRELLEASGRRLIFFISDCVSPAWQQGHLQAQYLDLWAKHGPVVVVQMLPATLWRRTALGEGLRVSFSAQAPGVVNSQLVSPALADWEDEQAPGLKLPVITLEPAAINQWARMLAGFGDAAATGVWFAPDWAEQLAGPLPSAPVADDDGEGPSAEAHAEQLVSRFSKTASDTARELAALMALVPVELSLIYLIQAKLLPDSTPLHVAEIFLSGLVQRVDRATNGDRGASDSAEASGSFFVTQRHYDFVPGVREILIDTVETPAAEVVLNEISAYIGQRIGKSIYSFTALLRLREELTDAGEEFLEFASVTKQALRRLGGEYAALVDDIEQPEVPDNYGWELGRRIEFPPLETLAFDKGELVDDEQSDDEAESSTSDFPPLLQTATFQIATVSLPQQSLEIFEFQTARIEREQAGLFRRLKWVVKKSRAQARRFVEPLSDDLGLEMVAIPDGTFLMGSPESEPGRNASEGPQHEVAVPDFFIGRYPVTQVQWQFVANLPQVNRELGLNPSSFKGDLFPVEQVSWYDAVEFCDRLSAYTDRQYRLPTEAEWEYACRAGTVTTFCFGDMILTEVANYDGSAYVDGSNGKNRGKTTSVNEFDVANAFGLSDMHGNIWEWCQDHWHENYQDAPTDSSAWFTSDKEARRIVRGGSWINYPGYCRSAYRGDDTPDNRYGDVGFRVSCSAPRT